MATESPGVPGAIVTVQPLDLASLDSIRAAADELRARHPRIDLLINNAGVMLTPRQSTRDGFELQRSRWCLLGRRDGVKISGCVRVCARLGLSGRGGGFCGLAGRLRVEDGRGRPLTPSCDVRGRNAGRRGCGAVRISAG